MLRLIPTYFTLRFLSPLIWVTAVYAFWGIPQPVAGQCPNDNIQSPPGTVFVIPATGQTFSLGLYAPGQYALLSTNCGSTYRFSTCFFTSFDTQITLYDDEDGSLLAFNDDFCDSASQVTLVVPSGVNRIRVLVDQPDCQENLFTGALLTVSHVLSTDPPIASCKSGLQVDLDGTGQARIEPALLDAGSASFAGCGVDLAVSTDKFTCADVGPQTVTLTVTDLGNGLTATCQTSLQVERGPPPPLDCKNLSVTLDNQGSFVLDPIDAWEATTTVVAYFDFTGAAQTFTVPAGVTQLKVTARGAGGGNSAFEEVPGGSGGLISGFVNVTPGETYEVIVGGPGQNAESFVFTPTSLDVNAGGGGGFSGLLQNGKHVITAGGGGGAAASGGSSFGFTQPGPGGDGGGMSGGNGGCGQGGQGGSNDLQATGGSGGMGFENGLPGTPSGGGAGGGGDTGYAGGGGGGGYGLAGGEGGIEDPINGSTFRGGTGGFGGGGGGGGGSFDFNSPQVLGSGRAGGGGGGGYAGGGGGGNPPGCTFDIAAGIVGGGGGGGGGSNYTDNSRVILISDQIGGGAVSGQPGLVVLEYVDDLPLSEVCTPFALTASRTAFSCLDVEFGPAPVDLVATDPMGNTSTCTSFITIDIDPNAGYSSSLDICENGDPFNLFDALGGQPSQSGVWSGPSPLPVGHLGTYDPVTMSPGIYTYSVTDSASVCPCLKATIQVHETPAPSPGTGGSLQICSTEGPVDLIQYLGGNPSPGGTWTGPGLLGNGDQGRFDPAIHPAGTYRYEVGGGGCNPLSTTLALSILPAPATPLIADIEVCEGGSTEVNPPVILGILYNFYDADPGQGPSNPLALWATGFDPGTHPGQTDAVWVTAYDGGCESHPVRVDVTVNSNPVAVGNSNSPLFEGQSLTLAGDGGFSYDWSGPNGYSSQQQNPVLTNAQYSDGGIYQVIVTDPIGCVDTQSLAVLVLPYSIRMGPKMMLKGPYDAITGLMRDDLRQQGIVPLQEPYSALGHSLVDSGRQISPEILAIAGPDAIVDWVLVELRDAADPKIVVASRSALLQRDGDVVDTDGISALGFHESAADSGNYFMAVRHRNHLGAMSLHTDFYGNSLNTKDFTTVALPLYGSNATKDQNGIRVLWDGDVLHDGDLRYSGPNNDRGPVLQAVGGNDPTQWISGYMNEDVNMDGSVKYSGPGNDRADILLNLGGSDVTEVKVEQVPN